MLAVLCVPMFLVLLDVLAMNIAMPTVGRAFGVPIGEWSLLVDTYTVPLALALLPGGVLVDRLGPRLTLSAGLAVFALASSAGAAAPTWEVVLAARAAQGLSAAVMLPAGLAALTATWPEGPARARALGIWSAVSAAATALGPAVGGLLVGVAGWRAVFWVNVPLVVLAFVGTIAVLGARSEAPAAHGGLRWRPLLASVAVAAMMTSGANGTLQVLTVHLQEGLGLDAVPAGAVLLLATAPFAVLGPVSGALVNRFGRRAVAAAGFVLGGAGIGTLVLTTARGVAELTPALLGIGVGLGLMTSAIVGETMSAWTSRPGVAGGLNNAFRQLGTSGGVALGGGLAGRLDGTGLLHSTGLAAGGWWLLAAMVVLVGFVPRTFARSTSPGEVRTSAHGGPKG